MEINKGFFKNKKVFITGGAGFIGSHLVRRLLDMGANITILVRENSNLWKIEDIKKDLEIFYANIQDKNMVENIIKSIKPDIVYHLAAYGVNSKKNDYAKALNVNVNGSLNVIEPLIFTGCEKIIYMGSSSEYGGGKEPRDEKNALYPLNIYGSTKAAGTILMHQIARENDIGIITIRPFGLFGEREERHKIFSYIISSILKKEEVKLTSCEQYRDYLYVENLIDAMILATESDIKNDIFNIGTGNVKKLKYYVDRIFNLTETDQKPLYGKLNSRISDMFRPEPNVDKIKNMLHWEERISLDEGLKLTVQWFCKNIRSYS
ncbi:NAD-dependent epimerase/dehydratase family protein [Clostridium sp. DL1XJH146]